MRLACVALLACNSASPAADAGPDAAADALVESGPTSCDASVLPTTSYSLTDWPALMPATATDWTSMAGVTTTAVTGAPAGVVVTHDGAWVFAATTTQIAVFKRTGTALTFDHGIAAPTGETPFGLALSDDGATLAVAMSDEVALYGVSNVEASSAGALLGYVPTHSVMKVTIDVAFSHDGRFVFAALEYDAAVAVVDVTKLAYVGAVPIAGKAVTSVAVAPDDSKLYVVCEASNEFVMANPTPAQDQIIGSVTVATVTTAETSPATAVVGHAFVGRAPVRVAVSSDGSTLWVTARGSNALLQLDAATLLAPTCSTLRSVTAVGPAPVGLALADSGKVVVVANSNRFAQPSTNQTLSFVSVASAALLGQIGVGAFPREIDDDQASLFVSNYDSRSLSGIDLTKLPLP